MKTAWGLAGFLRDWALLCCCMRHKRGMLKQGAESRGPQLLTLAAACLRCCSATPTTLAMRDTTSAFF